MLSKYLPCNVNVFKMSIKFLGKTTNFISFKNYNCVFNANYHLFLQLVSTSHSVCKSPKSVIREPIVNARVCDEYFILKPKQQRNANFSNFYFNHSKSHCHI